MAVQKNGDSPADSPTFGVDPEPEEEQHVIDDEKYSHSRRLRAIHNAHDRTLEVRNAVEERLIDRRIGEYHARQYYRSAVETFIMTVLPVLEREDIGLSEDYAEHVELGEVIISPPDELEQFARGNIGSMPPGAGVPEPVRQDVIGLRAVVDLPSPLTHTFAVAIQHGPDDVQVYRRQVSEELPRRVLDRAVRACADALDDADMGLDIGSDRPRNDLGAGGGWPWERDEVLPHELADALRNGDVSRSEIMALVDTEESDEE
jgi:hypothetical protein